MYEELDLQEELKGKTLVSVKHDKFKQELLFETDKGEKYKLYHEQDCCEDVYLEDICGDLEDLVGTPLLKAIEVNSTEQGPKQECADDSETWTFYRFATIKGSVTLRWYGTSNGYYSEEVSFAKIEEVKKKEEIEDKRKPCKGLFFLVDNRKTYDKTTETIVIVQSMRLHHGYSCDGGDCRRGTNCPRKKWNLNNYNLLGSDPAKDFSLKIPSKNGLYIAVSYSIAFNHFWSFSRCTD